MENVRSIIRSLLKEVKFKSGDKNNIKFTSTAKEYIEAYLKLRDAANILEGPGSTLMEYGLTHIIEVELAGLLFTLVASPPYALNLKNIYSVEELTDIIEADYAYDEMTAEKLVENMFKYDIIQYA